MAASYMRLMQNPKSLTPALFFWVLVRMYTQHLESIMAGLPELPCKSVVIPPRSLHAPGYLGIAGIRLTMRQVCLTQCPGNLNVVDICGVDFSNTRERSFYHGDLFEMGDNLAYY
jgi:hypothetical protein